MQKISYAMINKAEQNHWWFRVRREILELMLKKFFISKPGAKFLDVGCGAGITTRLLEKYGAVSALDVAPDALEYCRQNGLTNVYEASITATPFADSAFDVVIALDVLEHIEDDQAAVAEVLRVLKPGGLFIFYVPAFQFLWARNDVVRMHFRRYTKTMIEKLFAGNSWQLRQLSYFNLFLLPMIFIVRRLRELLRVPERDELEQMGSLNELLYHIFKSELPILKRANLPAGVSLIGVYEKK